jgi:WhiB family redox-sensing transcriptional regulator
MTEYWRDEAECTLYDPELFFPISYVSPKGLAQIEDAKQVCAECPVLAACRAYILDGEGGIDVSRRAGIYGGLTPKERFAVHRRSVRRRETAAA